MSEDSAHTPWCVKGYHERMSGMRENREAGNPKPVRLQRRSARSRR